MTIGEKLRVIRAQTLDEFYDKLNNLLKIVYPILEGAARCGAECVEVHDTEVFEDWKKLTNENEFEVRAWCEENDLEVEADYEQRKLVFSWE